MAGISINGLLLGTGVDVGVGFKRAEEPQSNTPLNDLLYAMGDGRDGCEGVSGLMDKDAMRQRRLDAIARAADGSRDSHRESVTTWDAVEALIEAQFIIGLPDGADDDYATALRTAFQMSLHGGKGRKFATPDDIAQERIDDGSFCE